MAPGPAQDRESGRPCTESFAANAKARACGRSFIVRSVGVLPRLATFFGEPRQFGVLCGMSFPITSSGERQCSCFDKLSTNGFHSSANV
jgi:hypothetical protein